MAAASSIVPAVNAVMEETEEFLCDLIRFPSTPGEEAGAMEYVARRFGEVAETERIPLRDALRDDPEYSGLYPHLRYEGRFNLRACLPGEGGGRSLLLNTHLDVVPPSQGQQLPFEPRTHEGVVAGRGACDAKGQAAAIFAAFLAVRKLGLRVGGNVTAHLVVEEEVGGNGTLAMVRRGERADACVVMEPTGLRIMTSTRGALWYRIHCTGRPVHGGSAAEGVSALEMAVLVMEILKRYHARLLAQSRHVALFERYANPMPILFGRLAAGDWPSMAPAHAVLEGMLGFLPNRNRREVMEELRQAIEGGADDWLREHFTIEFLYRHDCHVLDVDHPLATGLQACVRAAGAPGEIAAMTASCDAWFYHNLLGVPAVVFGPGELRFAHSDEEQVRLDEVAIAAAALVGFIQHWCGAPSLVI